MWGDLREEGTGLGACIWQSLTYLCGQPNCQKKMGVVKTIGLTGGAPLKSSCVQWSNSLAPPSFAQAVPSCRQPLKYFCAPPSRKFFLLPSVNDSPI